MRPTSRCISRTSLLFWAVPRRLGIRGAVVAAFLFALHPVNVQSVAWIAERKNLVAMLFFLLSIYWFIGVGSALSPTRWATSPADRRVASAFARLQRIPARGAPPPIASASSPSSSPCSARAPSPCCPLILVGISSTPARSSAKDALRLAPFFVVGGILAWLNVWFQGYHLHGGDPHRQRAECLLGSRSRGSILPRQSAAAARI